MNKKYSNIILFFIGVALILSLIWYGSLTETYRIGLDEISDGVYANIENVVSSIPSNNYTMTTIRDKSGNIYSARGDVHIINTDTKEPYAIWEDHNIVNGDKITLYIPEGASRYLGTISSSRN